MLALPVPPGAAIEEAGEALEVRLIGGHVHRDRSPASVARRRALAATAVAADSTLVEQRGGEEGRIALAAADGIHVEIDAAFVVFRIAYARDPDDAEAAFERLFRVVHAIVRETGWRVYDPQEACGIAAGDDGRAATLEIFLSVLDQLRAGFEPAARGSA